VADEIEVPEKLLAGARVSVWLTEAERDQWFADRPRTLRPPEDHEHVMHELRAEANRRFMAAREEWAAELGLSVRDMYRLAPDRVPAW
jgi:hypothetical protein